MFNAITNTTSAPTAAAHHHLVPGPSAAGSRCMTTLSDVAGVQNPSTDTLYEIQGGRCLSCGTRMARMPAKGRYRSGYTTEHIFPRCQGHGLFANKVLCCAECNMRKAAEPPAPSLIRAARRLYESLFPADVVVALREHPLWAVTLPALH